MRGNTAELPLLLELCSSAGVVKSLACKAPAAGATEEDRAREALAVCRTACFVALIRSKTEGTVEGPISTHVMVRIA